MNVAVDPMKRVFTTAGVIPVLTIENVRHAIPIATALVRGGLPVLEVTLRTAAALPATKLIAAEVPGAVVGVGTVMSARQIEAAAEAGAQFAISPGYDDSVARAARHAGLSWLPGVATPTEIMRAVAMGFETLKLFPAESLGGLSYVRALRGPFPSVSFCPTGGITAERVAGYLSEPNVLCVGGTWLVSSEAVEHERWDWIESHASAVSQRLAHKHSVSMKE